MKNLRTMALVVLLLTFSFSAFSKNATQSSQQTDTTYYTHIAYHHDSTTGSLIFYLYMTVGDDWTADRVTPTEDITQSGTATYYGEPLFTSLTIEANTNYASYNATGIVYSEICYYPGSGSVSPTTYNGWPIDLDPTIHSF